MVRNYRPKRAPYELRGVPPTTAEGHSLRQIWVDNAAWAELRARANVEGRRLRDVLDSAIRRYLETQAEIHPLLQAELDAARKASEPRLACPQGCGVADIRRSELQTHLDTFCAVTLQQQVHHAWQEEEGEGP